MDISQRKDISIGKGIVREPLRYYDEPDRLVVDFRREGVSFLPLASRRTGRSRTDAPALHIHPGMMEICYCLRGSLAFETPQRTFAFLPQSVFTSRDTEPHRMTANPKGLFVYRVLVRLPSAGRRFDGLDAVDSAWLRSRMLALPRHFFISGPDLQNAFERLFGAYSAPVDDSVRRRIELRRRALDVLLACVDAAARGASRRRLPAVERFVRQMESDPVADYPLDEMSRAASLSPSMFVKAFKDAAGLPPQAYLRNCRLRLATRMLDEGRSVLSTALKLKFSTAQYFATAFKAETGVSPSAWRKRSK